MLKPIAQILNPSVMSHDGKPPPALPSVQSPPACLAPEAASLKAAHLFGCYRKAEASDPDIYVAAVAAILSEYPQEVVEFVCDPRTGLPRSLKWLPSIAEIAEACEVRMGINKNVRELRALAQAKRALIASADASDAAREAAKQWLADRSGMIEKLGI